MWYLQFRSIPRYPHLVAALYLVSQLSFHLYLCICKNGSNLTTTFYVQIQNMNKISFFSYLGGGGPGGALTSNPRLPTFYGIMTL